MTDRRLLATASPLRLLGVGAVLLWLITPLALAGLITVGVRAHNAGGLGIGAIILLTIWALAALVVLVVGFGFFAAAVLAWWRARGASHVVETQRVES